MLRSCLSGILAWGRDRNCRTHHRPAGQPDNQQAYGCNPGSGPSSSLMARQGRPAPCSASRGAHGLEPVGRDRALVWMRHLDLDVAVEGRFALALHLASFGGAFLCGYVVAEGVTTGGVVTAAWYDEAAVILLHNAQFVFVLFAGSGRARRLVELSALAYWVQVVWAAVSLIAVLVAYSPSPLDLPISRGRLAVEGAMAEYLADEAGTPFMLSIRLVGVYFGLWFTALQACALRVVSGFSVVAASAAGVVMGFAFILLPWAVQRF